MNYLNSEVDDILGTILVVDDEKAIQTLLLNWLEPSGFTVEFASNGQEALDKATQIHPDAIVMDASMPVMGGFEALAEFQRRPELASIPIMMLTVHYEVRDIINALDMGAADYMQKPFNPQVLMARLRAIIRLRDSMERLAKSATSAPLLLTVNNEGQIIATTPDTCNFLNKSADELNGVNIKTILPWIDAQPWISGECFNRYFYQVDLNHDHHGCECQLTGISAGDNYTLSLVVK